MHPMPSKGASPSDAASDRGQPFGVLTQSQNIDSNRLPSAERAYRALKAMILANELPAGSQLLEQEAAAQLGMSRTPVREAMIRLERDGVAEIKPRHGMRVLPVSSADMREIYEVLTSLEATAAEMVASKGVTFDELSALKAAVSDMDMALERDDLNAWASADARFHHLLVTLTGNKRLVQMVEKLGEQAHRARMMTLRLRPKPVGSNKDHARLVEAIAARDGPAARQIHHEHRATAGRMLVALLDTLGFTQV